jgi:hypothetical protein
MFYANICRPREKLTQTAIENAKMIEQRDLKGE